MEREGGGDRIYASRVSILRGRRREDEDRKDVRNKPSFLFKREENEIPFCEICGAMYIRCKL